MRITKIFLLTLLVLTGNFSVNVYSSSYWDDFLRQPNKTTLNVLENTLKDNLEPCSYTAEPTQKQRSQLFNLIRSGNPSAFRAALMVSKCLDGGELGDFYRSAGIFFELRPYSFMQIAKDTTITDSQLKYMLTMLPLTTVDNIDKKISVVENRINILKSLKGETFNEIKRKGLYFLDTEKENLERINGNLENQ